MLFSTSAWPLFTRCFNTTGSCIASCASRPDGPGGTVQMRAVESPDLNSAAQSAHAPRGAAAEGQPRRGQGGIAAQRTHPEARSGAVGLQAQMKTSLLWPVSTVTFAGEIKAAPRSSSSIGSGECGKK